MANGQRKLARSNQKKLERVKRGGKGAFHAPFLARQNALYAMMMYDVIVNTGHNNAVYTRGRRIAHKLPLTRRHLRRMLEHFDAHQKDRDREWGEPGNDTPGRIAWNLNGGDEAAAWVRGLRDKL